MMFQPGERIVSIGNTINMHTPGRLGTVRSFEEDGNPAAQNPHDRSNLYMVDFDGGPRGWLIREYEIVPSLTEENFSIDA